MKSRYRVEITRSAERDVLAIRDDIAADKPTAAARWVTAISRQARSLKQFPFRGTVIPEATQLGVDYRQLLFGNYRTIYRIEAERVFIVRVIHGARVVKASDLT